jgi:hypothetical protein
VEFGKKGQRDGGRTGYKTGTVSLDDCFRSGVDNMNKGNYKTADQVNDARGLLLRSKNLLRAITKYGVLPELAFIGLESAGRTIMGDSVGDSIKKSIDTFTFGLTDFTSDINKKEFDAAGGFGDMKLNVDKYRANFDKVQALKRDIQNLEAMNVGGEFGYMGSRDDEIAFKKAALKKAEQELLSSKLPETQMKTIETYNQLLEMGVAREQARSILPLTVYTKVWWTASFQSIMNFIELRDEPTSQVEIQEYARAMKKIVLTLFPETTKLWSEIYW